MFVEIPRVFLARIATDSDRIPTLYYSQHSAVRRFFWMRLRLIYSLMRRAPGSSACCLDFGGGGGVFLPTLSDNFRKVVCIDLENDEAKKVVEKYQLANVELVRDDIATACLVDAPFDTIVAADVLEHFRDLSFPVNALRKWLAPHGILYTSLPSENYIYVFLRKIFGITKPWDHYHSAEEVEAFLANNGFRKIRQAFVPFHVKIFPLFYVSAWQLDGGNHAK